MISVYYLLLAISAFSLISLPVLGNPIPSIKLTDVSFLYFFVYPTFQDWPPPSGNPMTNFPKASVAADIPECNKAGTDVLKEGGNAVDSLITTLMCIGVFKPHSSGLGGGFMMTLYNAWVFFFLLLFYLYNSRSDLNYSNPRPFQLFG